MSPSWKYCVGALLWMSVVTSPDSRAAELQPAERRVFTEPEFQNRFNQWTAPGDDAARIQRARDLFYTRGLSSAQLKRLAQSIGNEDTRVEFVISAYPYTVDPENIYEVYDAFQTFSKVFRLHDRLAGLRRPTGPRGPMVPSGPPPLSDAEFAEMLATLRAENFDNGRLSIARVAGAGAHHRISSAQVAEMLDLFSFDNQRLECAKLGVDWVRDPNNLHLLYRKFTFDAHKRELTQAIEARIRKQ